MAASDGTSISEVVNEPQTLELNKSIDSTEAQIISGSEESSVNNGKAAEDKTLEKAAELMEKGTDATKEADYTEAAECFSRAVEIRVTHYGELAPECCSAYYKYGCALLYKAQDEADPLGSVPKKDAKSVQCSEKDGSLPKGECSASSAIGDAKQDEASTQIDAEPSDEAKDSSQINQTEPNDNDDDDDDDDEGSEDEGEDEDESDLDLAWKMLDLARAIVEKKPEDTMEKVDILSALGEVALEREDIETSLSDYSNALSILHRLVESDSRQIAELNFRICLVLEVGSKPEEAIPYCQTAISVCKARVQRLKNELNNATISGANMVSDDNQNGGQGSEVFHPDPCVLGNEAEVETLTGLLDDLEKKLEDLQQLVLQPNPLVSEFLKRVAAKSTENGTSAAISSSRLGIESSGAGFDSPTLSTAHTKGSGDGAVQHLGVVGRGVKRVSMSSSSAESVPVKKPSVEKAEDCGP